MRRKRNAWISAAALAALFAVTGCEIIAFSTGSSSSSASTGSGTSSSSGTSTSSGGMCTAPPAAAMLQCSTAECITLCNTYETSPCGKDPALNEYKGSKGCCSLCENFSKTNGDTAQCRLMQFMTTAFPASCAAAGPWSEKCGGANQDGLAEFPIICGKAPPAMLSSIGRSSLAAAAETAPNPKCPTAFCCYCAGAETNSFPTCTEPGCAFL